MKECLLETLQENWEVRKQTWLEEMEVCGGENPHSSLPISMVTERLLLRL